MRIQIAQIKMKPGNVGWYDPLSKISLSIGSPVGTVYSDMNLQTIKRGIKFGTIELLSGSLEEELVTQENVFIEPAKIEEPVVIEEPVEIEEVTEIEEVAEPIELLDKPIEDEVINEVVEKPSPKMQGKKGKASSKTK